MGSDKWTTISHRLKKAELERLNDRLKQEGITRYHFFKATIDRFVTKGGGDAPTSPSSEGVCLPKTRVRELVDLDQNDHMKWVLLLLDQGTGVSYEKIVAFYRKLGFTERQVQTVLTTLRTDGFLTTVGAPVVDGDLVSGGVFRIPLDSVELHLTPARQQTMQGIHD